MVGSDAASLTDDLETLRLDALAILRAAIDAVDPFPLVTSALADRASASALHQAGRIHLVAAGKAAGPMMRAACHVLQGRIGAALATDDDDRSPFDDRVERIRAAHPLPDEGSVRAASRALEIAANARARAEPLLVLLSGGASALMALPAPGITLEAKRRTIDALLRAGADIRRLNCVRKHLSSIKGGRLAAAAGSTTTLAISDVHDPEDDAAIIGSGPTVGDPSTYRDAIAVVEELHCDVPTAVRTHLERGAAGEIDDTPKPGDSRLAASWWRAIANRRTAMAGAVREAERRGYPVRVVDRPTSGEARTAGRTLAEQAMAARPAAGPMCVIASGETTVTVRGGGRGGRNQEFVLGAVRTLARSGPAALASVGTDGLDGPTDAAGALVTTATLQEMRVLGIDVEDALDRNDAYPVLAKLNALIRSGPTGTNVGDVHIVLTMAP